MALRGSRIEKFDELWCLVASRGFDFCVSTTSFQKNNIGWPQQPLKERVQISVKNLIFEDSIHIKGPVFVILVTRMITQSGTGSFLRKKGCRGC